MYHEPYEDWLLSSDDLNEEQKQALQEHLTSCEACSQLANAWQTVQNSIISLPEESPAPGFTQRWQERLLQARIRKQRRLTWLLFLLCAGGALIALLAIVLPQFHGLPSPVRILATLLYSISVLFSSTTDVTEFAEAFFQAVPLYIPILIWIPISTTIVIWSLIWMISVWRLPKIRRSQHEADN